MQCNAAGRVVLELKMPWLDGTTPQAMSRLEFMRRLEALVPRPRPQSRTTPWLFHDGQSRRLNARFGSRCADREIIVTGRWRSWLPALPEADSRWRRSPLAVVAGHRRFRGI
jgi:hypothetical protein